MQHFWTDLAILALVLSVFAPAAASAGDQAKLLDTAQVLLRDPEVPNTRPALAGDTSGGAWFVWQGRLHYVNPANEVTRFDSAFSLGITDIAVGADHLIWTVTSGSIIAFDRQGRQVVSFRVKGIVKSISAGVDGEIWFTAEGPYDEETETFTHIVGRINSNWEIVEYPQTESNLFLRRNFPLQIAGSNDGTAWLLVRNNGSTCDKDPWVNISNCTSYVSPAGRVRYQYKDLFAIRDVIARVTQDGKITEFPLPDGLRATSIALSPSPKFVWVHGEIRNRPVLAKFDLNGTHLLTLNVEPDFVSWETYDGGEYAGQTISTADGSIWVLTHHPLFHNIPAELRVRRYVRDTLDQTFTIPDTDTAAFSVDGRGTLWFSGVKRNLEVGGFDARLSTLLPTRPAPGISALPTIPREALKQSIHVDTSPLGTWAIRALPLMTDQGKPISWSVDSGRGCGILTSPADGSSTGKLVSPYPASCNIRATAPGSSTLEPFIGRFTIDVMDGEQLAIFAANVASIKALQLRAEAVLQAIRNFSSKDASISASLTELREAGERLVQSITTEATIENYSRVEPQLKTLEINLAQLVQQEKAKADAEAAAKAKADAEAAAKAKADAEAAAKAKAPAKKTTITCVRGKSIKKVTAITPKCPSGYKKR